MAVRKLKLVENGSTSKLLPADLIGPVHCTVALSHYVKSLFDYVIDSENLPYYVVTTATDERGNSLYGQTNFYVKVGLFDINDIDNKSDSNLLYLVNTDKLDCIARYQTYLRISEPFNLVLCFLGKKQLNITKGNELVNPSSVSGFIKNLIEQSLRRNMNM